MSMLSRVRTGPVPGSGLDRSRIFFWTGASPCTTFLTNYVCGGEGSAGVWQIAKCHAPAVIVGQINSLSVVAQ